MSEYMGIIRAVQDGGIVFFNNQKLQHDELRGYEGSEAYLSDIVRPAKRMLPQYKDLELKFQGVIEERFAVTFDHEEIHIADNKALYAEALHFYGDIDDWGLDGFEHYATITPLHAEHARLMFLCRFSELVFG